MNEILSARFLNNSLEQWAVALVVALGVFLAVFLARFWAIKRLAPLAEKTTTALDDVVVELLRRTSLLAGLVLALYIGTRWLNLDAGPRETVKLVATVVIFLQVGRWGASLVNFFVQRLKAGRPGDAPAKASALGVLSFIARLAVWSVVLFLVLDNLGVNITALVTGLGIGGVAVALAVQKILGDLFCSIAILIDKPFEEGDFIVVGEFMGTVEKIGLKSSRLRALSGEQIILSNQDLTESRIRNFKRMKERRVVFSFGVVFSTTPQKLERVVELVKEIIAAQPLARLERAHFARIGQSALEFEVAYFVLDRDFAKYMDVQQKVNLELVRRLAEEGIEFAYPTQTVMLGRAAG